MKEEEEFGDLLWPTSSERMAEIEKGRDRFCGLVLSTLGELLYDMLKERLDVIFSGCRAKQAEKEDG